MTRDKTDIEVLREDVGLSELDTALVLSLSLEDSPEPLETLPNTLTLAIVDALTHYPQEYRAIFTAGVTQLSE